MDMLQRMADAGQISRFRDNEAEPFIFMLKSPGLKFPGNWYNRKHELAAADLFTSFYHTAQLDHWDNRWSPTELEHYKIDHYKVYYDRKFTALGNIFFLEVDRGTEDPHQIDDKIEKYLAFQKAFPKEFFYVIITVQGSRYYNLEKRMEWIKKILIKRQVGYQFLLANHADLFAVDPVTKEPLYRDPFAPVFQTATSSKPIALGDLYQS